MREQEVGVKEKLERVKAVAVQEIGEEEPAITREFI
jgi:hypothetical protein